MKTLASRITLVLRASAVLSACRLGQPDVGDRRQQRARHADRESAVPHRLGGRRDGWQRSSVPAPRACQLLQVTGAPLCGVDFNYMHYWTVNASAGGDVAASAFGRADGADRRSAGLFRAAGPILLYAHGTQTDKNAKPRRHHQPETTAKGALIAAMFAAQGYIVVAPNYGRLRHFRWQLSSLPQRRCAIEGHDRRAHCGPQGARPCARQFHDGQRQAVHQRLFAGRLCRDGHPQGHAGRGHGGHGIGADVRAVCARSLWRRRVFSATSTWVRPSSTPLLTTSFQNSYGNIYAASHPTCSKMPTRAPSRVCCPTPPPIDQLIGRRHAAAAAAVSTTPCGIPAARSWMRRLTYPQIPLFALGFGPNNLVKDSYRFAYVMDALANPDGAVPAQTNLVAGCGTRPTRCVRLLR